MTDYTAFDLAHLQIAIKAAQVGLWSWDVDTDKIRLDQCARDLWGLAADNEVTFEDLSEQIYPADVDKVRAAFSATRKTLGNFEIDFRLKLIDEIRWVSARGQGDDKGMAHRIIFGIFLDVSQRKQAEEANELLADEMSHRVKNLLAMAMALARISANSTTTASEMASDLASRLTALGRAHDLVRPSNGSVKQTALLGDVFAVLLSAYDAEHASLSVARRVRVSLPRLGVREDSVTSLALIIHELATNSLKYGALSSSAGTIDVSATTHAGDDMVTIIWAEGGGPEVVDPAAQSGFGSKMIERAVSHTLGGTISFDWPSNGVIVTLKLDLQRLSG